MDVPINVPCLLIEEVIYIRADWHTEQLRHFASALENTPFEAVVDKVDVPTFAGMFASYLRREADGFEVGCIASLSELEP